jgi:uncharacterized protein HemX
MARIGKGESMFGVDGNTIGPGEEKLQEYKRLNEEARVRQEKARALTEKQRDAERAAEQAAANAAQVAQLEKNARAAWLGTQAEFDAHWASLKIQLLSDIALRAQQAEADDLARRIALNRF